jgi:hypothetical protein
MRLFCSQQAGRALFEDVLAEFSLRVGVSRLF